MKLKIILASLVIIWSTGCIAYVQRPGEVQVQVEPPSTVVRVTHTPPVVRYVHVQRTRRVVRHVHRHTHSCRHTARRSHQHRRTRANHRHHRRTRRQPRR